MAVSSGGKDSQYFRSYLGARFAAEAALEAMAGFAGAFAPAISRRSLFADERTQARIIRQLEGSIIVSWRKKVQKHLECCPFQTKEIDAVEDFKYKKGYRNGTDLEYAYRANVMAALVTGEYCLVVRNGDGECSIIDRNQKVSEPVPWNEKCKENYSTSMCERTAIWEFRHFCSETVPAALFLMTGGLRGSLGQEADYHAYILQVFRKMAQSLADAEKYLNEKLPGLSRAGGHGDMCLAAGISEEVFKAGTGGGGKETYRPGQAGEGKEVPVLKQAGEGRNVLKPGLLIEDGDASGPRLVRAGGDVPKPRLVMGDRGTSKPRRMGQGKEPHRIGKKKLPWRIILAAVIMAAVFLFVKGKKLDTREAAETQPAKQEPSREGQMEMETETTKTRGESGEGRESEESTKESLKEEMIIETAAEEPSINIPSEEETESKALQDTTLLPPATEAPTTAPPQPEAPTTAPPQPAAPTTAAAPPATEAPTTAAAPPPLPTTAPQLETPPMPPPTEAVPETQAAEATVDAGQAELDAALQMWQDH